MKKALIIIGAVLVALVVIVTIFFSVSFIGKKEAKKLVLEHAELKESDIKRWNIELNLEDGSWEYDVEFVYDNKEYNYELDAKTGDIIIHEIDR